MLQFCADKLHGILRDFFTLTGIRVVLIDGELNELMSYPENRFDFCAAIRRSPAMDARCVASDRNACRRCAKTRKAMIYHCHAGLAEAIVPIQDGNELLGYTMFGQILPRENEADAKARLRREFPLAGGAVDRLPVMAADELNAAATILQALTTYLLTERWVTPGRSEFIRRMDSYIEAHMEETITVADLCAAFQMGRTRLYAVSSDFLGCGLAEYIRRQRVGHAKHLLADTSLPIAAIAGASGFPDYNYFSRVFKRYCGVSAREYREQLGAPLY